MFNNILLFQRNYGVPSKRANVLVIFLYSEDYLYWEKLVNV